MSDLYLIGNGFDLYHGLPSNYYYFGCFLINHYPEFYSELGKMYGFTIGRGTHFLEEFDWVVEYDLFWKCFEERLGKLDPLWLEESLLDDLGLEYPDDAVDIDIPEVTNADTIKEYFAEWVLSTLNTINNESIIRKNIGDDKLTFSEEAFFISFNYTSLLESIYDIPEEDIFHIHGHADGNIEEELVIGHGNKRAIENIDESINVIEAETYYLSSQAERNRLNEFKAERDVLINLKKDTERLANNMCNHLRTKRINDIYIYGLSCGDVDMPYLVRLMSMFPNACWHFSYYDGVEKSSRIELVKKLGIETTKVEYFEFRNDNSKDIEKEIVSSLGIETYETV